MSRLVRLIVAGFATMLALLSLPQPAVADSDPAAASAAAGWVAANVDESVGVSTATDALFALAAAQDDARAETAGMLLEVVRAGGADYVDGSPDAAAKLAILAITYGEDPRTFIDGVDLVADVQAGVRPDGAFGAWPGPFASGLGMVALHRAGESVPPAMTTYLLSYRAADGGFSWGPGSSTGDADNTGLALMALLAAGSTAEADAAATWAAGHQNPDGSWSGYNPVNSTAVMGSALESAGIDQPAALAYLVGEQATSGAFLNGGTEDMMATTQAALGLGGVSYLDVRWTLPDPVETPADSEDTPADSEDTPADPADSEDTPAEDQTDESPASGEVAPQPATGGTAASTPDSGTAEATAQPSAGELAMTGGDVSALALAGGALVAAGSGLALARRYRR